MKIWSNKLFLFALIAAMVLALGAFVACSSSGGSDDDTSDDDTNAFDDDTTPVDDDTTPTDDDTTPTDDDTTPADDDLDDDTGPGTAPVLSNGLWDPTTLVLADYDDAPEQYWQSAFMFSVCDVDNDLLPDGAVYIYLAGTTQWFLDTTNPINWSFFNNPPTTDLSQVSDCGAPVQTGVTVGFGPASAPPAAGDYCVDIEVTDTQGNFSNKLESICVTMAAL
jgi:hypothetical protein